MNTKPPKKSGWYPTRNRWHLDAHVEWRWFDGKTWSIGLLGRAGYDVDMVARMAAVKCYLARCNELSWEPNPLRGGQCYIGQPE